MRLSRLQSIICQLDPRNIRLSAARPPNLFPPRTPLPRTDRPPSLSVRVHSLVPRLLFGVSSPFLLAARLRAAVLPGFRPSSRHHRKRPLMRELPIFPLSSVLRFSQPLDGLLRFSTLRAYCIPQPRPGFFRPGISPDSQPFRLVAGPCPRAVVARTLTDRSRLPRSNASTSRPCSVNRCVPRGWCLAFPSVAPLFGFLLLQAPLTHHGTGSPAPPLVTFPSKSCPVPEST